VGDIALATFAAGIAVGGLVQKLESPHRVPARRYDDYDEIAFEPWTREWYIYCSKRYRTFNPETGTYRARSGKNRLCNPN
jgi:BA14K-like protein